MPFKTDKESISASTDKSSEFMGLFKMIFFLGIWGLVLLGIVAFCLALPVVIIVSTGLSSPASVLCLTWLIIVVIATCISYPYFR